MTDYRSFLGIKRELSEIKKIIIHHSGGKMVDSPMEIEAWHRVRFWASANDKRARIGYHYVMYKESLSHSLVLEKTNLDLDYAGVHCVGHNRNSIGVCVSGNYNNYGISARHELLLKELLDQLTEQFNIPKTEIYGHKELNYDTECPGRNLMDFIQDYRLGDKLSLDTFELKDSILTEVFDSLDKTRELLNKLKEESND